ncbi:uncharacterized protein MONBRDRAFT_7351 [Monosiga brevicollis MX1]|uniref:TROVE domain-containing protein n=1 Tax=Monosiga brevicollis TaxID=81824 RepID=A9UWP9_MONBE|nr:uncharacterized protein MONBRDRAFT_7351 [Monosiga brevicollis MX1]EDQ90252.1 predicted protein [Monosiga brevicollis MX1]|eukprot:XP_001745019.1 hypothetical protein [Monosiga brevicollis MX1]
MAPALAAAANPQSRDLQNHLLLQTLAPAHPGGRSGSDGLQLGSSLRNPLLQSSTPLLQSSTLSTQPQSLSGSTAGPLVGHAAVPRSTALQLDARLDNPHLCTPLPEATPAPHTAPQPRPTLHNPHLTHVDLKSDLTLAPTTRATHTSNTATHALTSGSDLLAGPTTRHAQPLGLQVSNPLLGSALDQNGGLLLSEAASAKSKPTATPESTDTAPALREAAALAELQAETRAIQASALEAQRAAHEQATLGSGVDAKHATEAEITADLKARLINALSAALIGSPDWTDRANPTRRQLIKLIRELAVYDAEFILKAALYTRQELNIRTAANFVLAVAATLPDCRCYLRKYLSDAVRLPSDWIAVAELFQTLYTRDSSVRYGSLPAALRKAMIDKFADFDEYQLAKYNKSKKKKPASKDVRHTQREEPSAPAQRTMSHLSEDPEDLEKLTFSLKQLIRKLHVVQPARLVMGVLGKPYPNTSDEFRLAGLEGVWDPERAGQRMRLAVPITWETQVSAHGNKAETWERLMDKRKLPFMAMLRNLRNLVQAQVNKKYHNIVCSKLSDPDTIAHSRQFPFAFFNAFEVLDRMSGDDSSSVSAEDARTIRRYRLSLEAAVGHATKHNFLLWSDATLPRLVNAAGLDILEGTQQLVQMVHDMRNNELAAAGDWAALDANTLVPLVPDDLGTDACTLSVADYLHELEAKFDDMVGSPETAAQRQAHFGLPIPALVNLIVHQIPVKNIINLTGTSVLGANFNEFLQRDAILRFVADAGDGPSVVGYVEAIDRKYQLDEKVAKRIAEHQRAQRPHVLPKSKKTKSSIGMAQRKPVRFVRRSAQTKPNPSTTDTTTQETSRPRLLPPGLCRLVRPPNAEWPVVQLFISSTFRDMQGERDALVRLVVPELKKRAATLRVHLHEVRHSSPRRCFLYPSVLSLTHRRTLNPHVRVRTHADVMLTALFRFCHHQIDLRWGVTEHDAKQGLALSTCLSQVASSHLFLGLLGERYGYVVSDYDERTLAAHPWLCVQDEAASDATGLNASAQSLHRLKSHIRATGAPTFDYHAQFAVERDGMPVAGDLDEFVLQTTRQLWLQLQRVAGASTAAGKCSNVVDHADSTEGVIWSDDDSGSDDDLGDDPDVARQQRPLSRTERTQRIILHQLAARLVGQDKVLHHLVHTWKDDLLSNDQAHVHPAILLLSGEAASGKTLVLAKSLQSYIRQPGCSDRNVIALIQHGLERPLDVATAFLHRLVDAFDLASLLPESNRPLQGRLLASTLQSIIRHAVRMLPGHTKLILALDGLPQPGSTSSSKSARERSSPLAELLDLLGGALPSRAMLVVALRAGATLTAAKRSMARYGVGLASSGSTGPPVVLEVRVGPLSAADRRELVFRTLKRYGKQLDETPFRNQMGRLLSKRGASSPVYLLAACEELRLAGRFENLDDLIQRLPSQLDGLYAQLFHRLAQGHPQAPAVLKCLATVLLVSANGTAPNDMQAFAVEHVGAPTLVVAEMLTQLEPLLGVDTVGGTVLRIPPGGLRAILTKHHKLTTPELRQAHRNLARYYRQALETIWTAGAQVDASPALLLEALHHTIHAADHAAHEALFFRLELVQSLAQSQCLDAARALLAPAAASKPCATLLDFIVDHYAILRAHPDAVLQVALNTPPTAHAGPWRAVAMTALTSAASKGSGLASARRYLEVHGVCPTTSPLVVAASTQQLAAGPTVLCTHSNAGVPITAVGRADGTVEIGRAESLEPLHTLAAHSAQVTAIVFLTNHKGEPLMCTAGADGEAALWDWQTGERCAVLAKASKRISALGFAQGSQTLVVGDWSGTVRTFDPSGRKLKPEFREAHAAVSALEVSPGSDTTAIASWDHYVYLWNCQEDAAATVLGGHQASVQHLCWLSANVLVSCDMDRQLFFWDRAARPRRSYAVSPLAKARLSQPVHTLATSADALIVGDATGTLTVHEKHFGQQLPLLMGYDCRCVAIAETHCIVGTYGGRVLCCARPHLPTDTASTRNDACQTTDGVAVEADVFRNPVHSLVVLEAQGDWLVACADEHEPRLELLDAKLNALARVDLEAPVVSLAAHGDELVVALQNAALLIYRVDPQGTPLLALREQQYASEPIRALAFASFRNLSYAEAHGVFKFNTQTMHLQPTEIRVEDSIITCVAAVKSVVLTGTTSGELRLEHIKHRPQQTDAGSTVLEGHQGAVLDCALDADCDCAASIGIDGTLRLWSVATGTELSTIPLSSSAFAVTFADDVLLVATAQGLMEVDRSGVQTRGQTCLGTVPILAAGIGARRFVAVDEDNHMHVLNLERATHAGPRHTMNHSGPGQLAWLRAMPWIAHAATGQLVACGPGASEVVQVGSGHLTWVLQERVIVADGEQRVWVYETDEHATSAVGIKIAQLPAPARCYATALDGPDFAVACWDNWVCFMRLGHAGTIHRMQVGQGQLVALTYCNDHLVVADDLGFVFVLTGDGQVVRRLHVPGCKLTTTTIQHLVTRTTPLAATVETTPAIEIVTDAGTCFTLTDMQHLSERRELHAGPILYLGFLDATHMVTVGAKDRLIRVWAEGELCGEVQLRSAPQDALVVPSHVSPDHVGRLYVAATSGAVDYYTLLDVAKAQVQAEGKSRLTLRRQ